jgi:hypothetical protein
MAAMTNGQIAALIITILCVSSVLTNVALTMLVLKAYSEILKIRELTRR